MRRRRFHAELQEEMAFHREQAERQLREEGAAGDDARYAAQRQFGNATGLREQSVELIAFRWETAVQDLRYALRQLRRSPGFAITTVAILALGIGATAAIFSAVNPILFEPLPYPQARDLVTLSERRPDGQPSLVTFGTYYGIAERSRALESVAVMRPWLPTMTSTGEPERFAGQRVTARYFHVLGMAPALGRDFQLADDQFHGPNVVILSDKLWRRRFHADAGIVGDQITLDGNLFTVIGVMPTRLENVLAPRAELWAPLQYNVALPSDGREWGHHLRMVGRLQHGMSRQQANSELDAIMHTLAEVYSKGYASSGGPAAGFIVTSLQADVTSNVRPALLAVFGAVVLVLLIACVNVTNLLLARGAQRRGEFAVRAALGAAPVRMLRQLTTESLVLALLGGVLGILLAQFGVRALVALSPPGLPRLDAIRLNGAVFGFGFAVTTLIGLLVGVIPALHATRGSVHSSMQPASPRVIGGHQWTRRTLVVTEVALALVLLVSAGLLLRSLQRLFSVDAGFDPGNVITMQVQESGRRYSADAARLAFFDRALAAVRAVPGVVSAGFTAQLPLSGDFDIYGAYVEGETPEQGEGLSRYAVTPGYVETLHIPLLRGRLFNERDTAVAPRVALINDSFAKRKFPNQNPIGKRICIRCTPGPNPEWSTIVGVVGDVRQASLEASAAPAVYIPNAQWYWADNLMSLVVRTRGDAAALAPALRRAIWSVDKDQPIVRVATMGNIIVQTAAERRFALVLFEAFALVALLLAATGIYGVLAGSVTERTREIGVRCALGASRRDIVGLILKQGITLTVIGALLGLVGAAAASRLLMSLLFGVSRLDPATYGSVVLLLLLVSVLACGAPAWRAARVDPAITLRAE